MESLEARRLLAVVLWTSDSDGDWSDASNWQDQTTLANRVPGFGDDVVIDRASADPEITVTGNQRANSLIAVERLIIDGALRVDTTATLDAGFTKHGVGNLDIRGAWTLAGDSNWSAGKMFAVNDGVTLQSGATLSLEGPNPKSFSGTLFNEGQIIVTGDGTFGGGTINNEVTGVWDFQSDSDFAGTTVFNNRGMLRKSGGNDLSSMNGSTSAKVNHFGGTIDVTSGTLALAGSDRNHSTEHGATITVASGATLDLTGGNLGTYFSGRTTGSGEGRVEFSSGRLLTGRIGDTDGAVFDFSEGMFHISGGTIFSPESSPITNIGFMTLSGAEPKTINSGYVVNEGTIRQLDVGMLTGGIGSTIENRAGAIWDFQTDTTTERIRLINSGTVKKTGGVGESTFGGINAGLAMLGGVIESQSGRLKFDGVNNISGVPSTGGRLNASAGAVVELAPFNLSLGGDYSGTGAGRVELTTRIDGDLANPPRFDFSEGLFHWIGNASQNSSGIFINDGSMTLDGPENVRARAYITNNGTIVQSDGAHFQLLQTSAINNNGLWEIRGDGSIEIVDFGGIGSTFNNFGELRNAAGSGTGNVFATNFGATSFFNNIGLVNVQSGTLEIDAQVKQLDLSTNTLHDGTWRIGPSSTLRLLDSNDDLPAITAINANVILAGASSEFPNISDLERNGGRFELQDGRDFATNRNLINGVERFETEMLDYFNVDFLSAGGGRLVGVAADATTGTVITYSLNDRDADQNTIFREYDSDGIYLPPAIVQPGGPVNRLGIDLISASLNIGGTDVPEQSMIFVHGNVSPPTLYALDKQTGVELASVLLTDLPINITGIAHHPSRGTFFAMDLDGMIYEFDSVDGSTLNSFPVTPPGAPLFSGLWGGLDVRNSTGNLHLVGGNQKLVRELTPSGEFVFDYDLTNFGTAYEIFSDISFNDANEEVWITSENGLVYHFAPFQIATFGHVTLGPGSTLTTNGDFIDTSANTINLQIGGRPESGGFGKLDVTGDANLSGTIDVQLVDGFGAVPGDSYQVVTYASRSGDDPAFTGLDSVFESRVESTQVVLDTVASASDLSVDAGTIDGPTAARPGEAVNLSFSVENLLTAEAFGPWVDSILLSRDRILSPDDLLIGTATRTAPVPGNSSYVATIAGHLPAVVEGDYYLIAVADAGRVVADVDRNNNVGNGNATVVSEIPVLAIGSQIEESFQPGQSRYYRVDIPDGSRNVLLQFDSGVNDASVELFVDHGRMPTRSDFAKRSREFDSATASIDVNDPSGQPTYVLVHARNLSSTVNGVLAASIPPLAVDRVTQRQIGNEGTATIEVFGAQLSKEDTFELVSGNQTVIAADAVVEESGKIAWIRFDVDGAALGNHDLVVTQQGTGTQVTLGDAVEIVTARRGELSLQLLTPNRFRNVRVFGATLVYENTGNVDMAAPVITIVADNGKLNRYRGQEFDSDRLMIIGSSQTGDAGILRPGERYRVNFRVLPDSVATLNLSTQFATAASQEPIDWDAVEQQTRPPGISDEEWDRFFVPFKTAAGNQWSSYVDLLSQTSAWVQRSGGDFLDGPTVLSVAQRRAWEAAGASITGVLSDTAGAVSGATLLASNVNDENVAGMALSRWDGSYVFTGLPDGTYLITVDGYRLPAPVEVDLTNGTVTTTDIVVDRGAGVSGVVTNSSDASVIAGATVTTVSDTGDRKVALTDESGKFLVTGLARENHQVIVEATGFGTKLVGNLDLSDGRMAVSDVSLDAASQIVGRLSSTIGVTEAPTIIAENQVGQIFLAAPDTSGGFSFDDLPAAQWTLSIDAEGHVPASINVVTISGSTADLDVVTLTPGDPLEIKVTDANSNLPIEDAWVEIQTPTGEFLDSGPTDVNGTFLSNELLEADFNIVASAVGYMISAATFNEGSNPLLTIELPTSGIIRGSVVDEDANRIAGIPVQLLLESPDVPHLQRSTLTDAAGNYEFTGLGAATFAVAVGNDVGLFRQEFVVSAQNNLQTYDIVIPGSTVSGVLVEADGSTPVDHGAVYLIESGVAIATAETNENGEYLFRVLEAGTYSVAGASDTGITSEDVFALGADEDFVADPLIMGGLRYTLNVMAADGQPADVGAVTVKPQDAPNLAFEQVELLSAGLAQIDGLVAGDYVVTVSPNDGISYSFDLTLSIDATDSVQTPTGSTVSGNVKAESDAVPVRADLWLYDAAQTVRTSVVADENGNFVLQNVPSGDYQLIALAVGYEVLKTPLTVAGGDLLLNLSLKQTRTLLAGTVIDESSVPVAGAEITIKDQDGVVVEFLTTGFHGNWSTAALPVGNYDVLVSRFGFRPAVMPASVVMTPGALVTTTLTSVATDDDSIFIIPFLSDQLLPALSAELARDEVVQSFFRRFDLIAKKLASPPELPNFDADQCYEWQVAWIAAFEASHKAQEDFRTWKENFEGLESAFGASKGAITAKFVEILAEATLGKLLAIATAGGSEAALSAATLARLNLIGIAGAKGLLDLAQAGVDAVAFLANDIRESSDPWRTLLNGELSIAKVSNGSVSLVNAALALRGLATLNFSTLGTVLNTIDSILILYDTIVVLNRSVNDVIRFRDGYRASHADWRAKRIAFEQVECPPCEEEDPPDYCDPPPPTPPGPGPSRGIGVATSSDPNDKLAIGVGDQGYVLGGETITYTIRFENMPTADLPAQEVFVTDFLSDKLDWASLELLAIGFNNVEYELPEGLSEFEGRIEVPTDDFPVDTTVTFDADTGELHWYMHSVDPLFDGLPEVPQAGFLPPNDASGRGEGFLVFRARLSDGAATDDVVENNASIVFDDNPAIVTNTTVNTVDDVAPTSAVLPLDDAFGTAEFTVDWSGQDNSNGSGIADYDLYVSRDGGPFELLLGNTSQTSSVFTGESGTTYGFATVARDRVGNVEPTPSAADSETLVVIGAWVNPVNPYDVNGRDGVSPLDALLVLYQLALQSVFDPVTHVLIPVPPDGYAPPYYDVTQDGRISPLDALRVINEIARQMYLPRGMLGEQAAIPLLPSAAPGSVSSVIYPENETFWRDQPISRVSFESDRIRPWDLDSEIFQSDLAPNDSPEIDLIVQTLADDLDSRFEVLPER